MAQQDGAAKKNPAVAALHSHFIVGSVSEENSEDEIQGKPDLQLEEKETRSLSPSSGSSDSTYEMGFDHIDGPIHNLRLEFKPYLSPSLLVYWCSFTIFCTYYEYDISYVCWYHFFLQLFVQLF